MKAQYFVVLAAGLVASAALAENTNTNNSTVNQSATAPAIPGVPAATATKASVAAPVAQGATSTASLPATAAAAQPRKVKFGLTTVQMVPKTSFDSGDYVPATDNLVSMSYALSATQSVSVRQGFTYSYPKNGAPGAAKMSDTSIQFVDGKVAEFRGWGLTGLGRVALPTGEGSRFTHRRKGYLMGLGSLSNTFGRTDVSFTLVGIYFNSPDASYMSGGKLQPNPAFEIDPEVSLGYNLTDTLSVFQVVGTTNAYMRSSPNMKVIRDQALGLETGVTYVLKPVSITGSVSNSVNIWDNSKPFALYNDDDMTYTLTLAASL